MKWYNPQNAPFLISGFPFFKEDRVYRRMPLQPSHVLPEAVDRLANETSGGQIRFHGKLKTLEIEVSLAAKPLFFDKFYGHMTLAAKSSFDLYVSRGGGDYIFSGVNAFISPQNRFYKKRFIDLEEPEEFDILLNFPLYDAVDKILIGVDDEAVISPTQKPFTDSKKIAIYGGSIQQGGCASRPGMSDCNLLSRWLNREVFNLGFNSSGKAEPEVAHVIADIGELAALVISTEGNCPDAQWLDEKLREFIRIYRSCHPETPIVIMPFFIGGADLLDPRKHAERLKRREVQAKIVEDLRAAGDQNIHLLLRDAYMEPTFEGHSVLHELSVDGLHLNDLGFYQSTQILYRFLKEHANL